MQNKNVLKVRTILWTPCF